MLYTLWLSIPCRRASHIQNLGCVAKNVIDDCNQADWPCERLACQPGFASSLKSVRVNIMDGSGIGDGHVGEGTTGMYLALKTAMTLAAPGGSCRRGTILASC